jgi:DNA-binding NarL/FixJ family response regulator
VERGLEFEVGLIDLGLPDIAGEELIQELGRRCPGVPLVAFTVRADDAALFGALRAGAAGYLLKDASTAELEAALALASGGGSPLSPGISRRVVSSFQPSRALQSSFGLSPREADVLDVLGSGASYRQVGRELGISEGTVQTYVKKIYEKLGVHSKAEAVRVLLERRTPRGAHGEAAREAPRVATGRHNC